MLNTSNSQAQKDAQKRREDAQAAVVHPFDVQRLLLRAVLGNDFKPRWCKLKNQRRLNKVICIVADGLTASDWYVNHTTCRVVGLSVRYAME